MAKIGSNNTKELGVEQCHKIIAENRGDRAALRVFIGVLTDNKTIGAGGGVKGNRELHVLVFGFLGKVYGQELKDPKDKPSSLSKTVKRILEGMFCFFKDDNKIVNKAVGMSM